MEDRLATYGRRNKSISNPLTVIITVGICLGCWSLGYLDSTGLPLEPGANATPIWRSICLLLADKDMIAYVSGCGLLFFISFLVQRGSFLLLILKGRTLLPFLFYLLLNSTNAVFFPIQSTSFALLFLLAAIFELFNSYQKLVNIGRIFNATMFIAIGSLFWVYLLWFIPLFWFGLYKFKLLNVRSFYASFLGAFTTYWFVLAWCVWKHDYSLLLIPLRSLADIDLIFLNETIQVGKLIPFCIIMFILIAVVVFNKIENTLRARHYLSFLLVFSIYSFLLIFLYGQDIANILSIFYVPTSVLIAYLFSNKRGFISYLIYYGMLLVLVILFVLRLWNIL
ncbi:MAG: hypothetical protein LBV72_15495 [Tannerella sp.]|jgi:hypothetical protein|nr:hypothetical protein [Tannerella sp.]